MKALFKNSHCENEYVFLLELQQETFVVNRVSRRRKRASVLKVDCLDMSNN
jgi:hypothetical protein